jgi:crotonobetainyl-CoA:carnitine CoA-transferase CaiB-like acyl-CoA transferase
LVTELQAVFEERDAADWLADFRAAGLPCGPINDVPDVFAHPQAEARQLALEAHHPTAGVVRTTGFPYTFSDTPAEVRLPPPRLGEHTQAVLTELLGYSAAEVADLEAEGAI